VTIYDPSTSHANPNLQFSLPISLPIPLPSATRFPNDAVPAEESTRGRRGCWRTCRFQPCRSASCRGLGSQPGVRHGAEARTNLCVDLRTNAQIFSIRNSTAWIRTCRHGDGAIYVTLLISCAERDFTPENTAPDSDPLTTIFANASPPGTRTDYLHLGDVSGWGCRA